uniref:Uncharacterized protein n=1 Tax=Arion vulgaris TaxID=1028688 RepID=A0A0B7B2A0_9EUPU
MYGTSSHTNKCPAIECDWSVKTIVCYAEGGCHRFPNTSLRIELSVELGMLVRGLNSGVDVGESGVMSMCDEGVDALRMS